MERFQRAQKYDQEWTNVNKMGPNPLWLLEELINHMTLRKDMRILDMGCGRAITSIFLAREYDVQVWANDLWIDPTENWGRIRQAGVEDRVCPIRAEAHSLPYANEFFDALISIDAYHYFGTDETYLQYHFHKLVKKDGQIGVVVPGLTREFDQGLPANLAPHWQTDMYTFHSADWWKNHWKKTGLVRVELAQEIEDGKELWLASDCDMELLNADKENYLTLIMMVATRN